MVQSKFTNPYIFKILKTLQTTPTVEALTRFCFVDYQETRHYLTHELTKLNHQKIAAHQSGQEVDGALLQRIREYHLFRYICVILVDYHRNPLKPEVLEALEEAIRQLPKMS
jgi:hypothetical protein